MITLDLEQIDLMRITNMTRIGGEIDNARYYNQYDDDMHLIFFDKQKNLYVVKSTAGQCHIHGELTFDSAVDAFAFLQYKPALNYLRTVKIKNFLSENHS